MILYVNISRYNMFGRRDRTEMEFLSLVNGDKGWWCGLELNEPNKNPEHISFIWQRYGPLGKQEVVRNVPKKGLITIEVGSCGNSRTIYVQVSPPFGGEADLLRELDNKMSEKLARIEGINKKLTVDLEVKEAENQFANIRADTKIKELLDKFGGKKTEKEDDDE